MINHHITVHKANLVITEAIWVGDPQAILKEGVPRDRLHFWRLGATHQAVPIFSCSPLPAVDPAAFLLSHAQSLSFPSAFPVFLDRTKRALPNLDVIHPSPLCIPDPNSLCPGTMASSLGPKET